MKQLLVILSMLISTGLFSQVKTIKSYKNQVGVWNQYTKQWDWESTKAVTIPIHFGENMVWIENQDKSTFSITENEGESNGTTQSYPYLKWKGFSWLATDKRGLTCRLALINYFHSDYDMVFTVSYSDAAIRFYCDKNQLNLIQ